MIYQVLSRPRTGSGLLYRYACQNSENTVGRLAEYFAYYDSDEHYIEKFEFLEKEKEKGRHYCLKMHIGQVWSNGYFKNLSQVIDYLNDYHVCITERNPWDSYLSNTFCEMHDWKISHKDLDGYWSSWTEENGKIIVDVDEDNFILPINEESIKQYVKVYKRDISLIKEIKPLLLNYTVFQYDTFILNEPKLKQFFNKEVTINLRRNNINYEAHIPFGLVDHYKAIFDKYLNE